MVNILPEIEFKTARSCGKGGQNVNKVETMVEGYFHVTNSKILTENQKYVILQKLSNKISQEGYLIVKSQRERSQLANKEDVIVKMHLLITKALIKTKKRKATKPTAASKQKRLKTKKEKSLLKTDRRKITGINREM